MFYDRFSETVLRNKFESVISKLFGIFFLQLIKIFECQVTSGTAKFSGYYL